MKRATDGDIFRFPLENGEFGYGQCVYIYQKIFDLFDSGEATAENAGRRPVAFVTCLSKGTILQNEIERIGKVPLVSNEEQLLPRFYEFDQFKREFRIVVPGVAARLEASREDCYGLRRASVSHYDGLLRRISEYRTGEVTMEGLLYGPLQRQFNIEKYYVNTPPKGVKHVTPSDYLDYEGS